MFAHINVNQHKSAFSRSEKNVKEFLFFIFETLKIVIIAAVIVIPIRYFLFQPFIVRGDSMESNFHSGDYLLTDELSYRFREPKRGEVIVFRPPNQPSTRYIKRIIGLPKETIQIQEGRIVIWRADGTSYTLDESGYLPTSTFTPGSIKISLNEEEFFVLGDNRQFSSDSRIFGVLPRKDIVGRVFFRAFPFDSFTTIAAPFY